MVERQASGSAAMVHCCGKRVRAFWRWEDDGGVNLYHCADAGRGFFVEVGIDDSWGQAVVLRSFSDSEALEDYAQGMQLPE